MALSRRRVVLMVGLRSVRAALVRGTVVVHSVEAERNDDESLAGAVATALDALAKSAGGMRAGTRVMAALSPTLVQLRELQRLPQLDDARALHAIVENNAERFFLAGSGPLRTSAPVRGAAGTLWASAVEEATIAAIADGCVAHRTRLSFVCPAAAVAHIRDGVSSWSEDGLMAQVRWSDGRIAGYDRARFGAGAPASTPRPDLVAVSRMLPRPPLAIGMRRGGAASPLRILMRMSLVAVSLLASGASLAAPGLLAERRASANEARLEVMSGRASEIAVLTNEIARANGAIARVAEFQRTRQSMLRELASITQVLPESSAILSLRADTIAATLVVVSRSAADVLAQLADARGIARPRLIGAVTREHVNGAALDRATIRAMRDTGGAR